MEKLKFTSNNIINLQIGNSTNIQSLFYDYQFTKIGLEEFEKTINYSENIREMLSESHFPNLSRLNISYSGMTRLERKLFNSSMPLLRFLNVSSNCLLETIDHDAFSDLKQLDFLHLSNNSIDSLDKKLFSGLFRLENLYLNRNRLKNLDANIFSDLKSLKRLWLSGNQLEILDAKSFVGLENLNELNLSNNKLSHFDVRILDNLPGIKKIDLSKNEISIENAEILKRFNDSKIEFKF